MNAIQEAKSSTLFYLSKTKKLNFIFVPPQIGIVNFQQQSDFLISIFFIKKQQCNIIHGVSHIWDSSHGSIEIFLTEFICNFHKLLIGHSVWHHV